MRRDTHYAHPSAGERAREGGEGDEREGDTGQEKAGKPSARRSDHKPERRGEQGTERDWVKALAIIRGTPELLVVPDGHARLSEPDHEEVHTVRLYIGSWSVATSERPGGPSGT